MKVKRGKHARKVMTFYKGNFGFEPPYKLLVDGTFCKAALSFKVNIAEQVPKYLETEVQIFTTACAMAECEALSSILYGPLKVLRQYGVAQCGHSTPIQATRCLKSMLKKCNKGKFILGTQDPTLTELSRTRPGIPLLYIAHNAITLESPSEASKNRASEDLHSKLGPTDYEHEMLKKLKTAEFGEKTFKKKKHKKKGKNPLSCKKKSKKTDLKTPLKEKKRRKRKRVKVSEHVKEHLKQQKTAS